MKKLTYILTSKLFWVTVGIICISLLIWFYGALLSLKGYKPLYSSWVRALLISFLIGFFIIRVIWRKYRQAKVNDELINEMQAAQEPMLKHEKGNSSVRQQFEEIDKLLRNAKFANNKVTIFNKYFNGQYLYQMPWYIVLGDMDSGKSSLLKNSGLNFPLESSFGSSIDGLAGTKDCSWFLSDDAVWLDTPGKFAIQNKGSNDIYDWQEFLDQLQRYRSKQPLNGAVLTLSVDQLLSSDEELIKTAKQLRKRINEMYTQFEIKFPVYLIITKLDKLKGFEPFFSHIPEEYYSKTVGFEIPPNKIEEGDRVVLSYVARGLSDIKDHLDSSFLHLMNGFETTDEKLALTTFPDDFRILNERIVRFCEIFFKSSKFEKSLFWRGVYFTSSIQGKAEFSPSLQNVAEAFALNNVVLDSADYNSNQHSYFIKNLLSKNIVKEANLAEFNTSWSYRFRSYRWIPVATAFILISILVYLLFNSYFLNREYLYLVESKVDKLHNQLDTTENTHDIIQAIRMAQQIHDVSMVENVELDDLMDPPFRYRMGLYKGKSMQQISDLTYYRALRETLLPMIHHRVDWVLRQSIKTDTASSYDTLKAYIMFYDTENYDEEAMKLWLLKELKPDLASISENDRIAVEKALDYVLDEKIIAPSLPYDGDLVKEAREQNTKYDLAHMILENTYNQIERDINADEDVTLERISFLTMGGNGTRQVFTAKDDHSLSEFIDYRFTRDIYEEYILPEIESRTEVIAAEESWVLGEYASRFDDQKKTFEQVKRAYYLQYIEEWERYLGTLNLKQPESLEQAKEYLKVLSDEHSSPLLKMMIEINYNTSLGSSDLIYNQITETITQTTDSFADTATEAINNTFGRDDEDETEEDSEENEVILNNMVPRSTSSIRNNLNNPGQAVSSEVRSAQYQVRSDVYGVMNEGLNTQGNKVIDLEEGTVRTLVRTLVDEHFIDYSNLVGQNSDELSNMDEIIDSIEDLYEYMDELNFSIDKGVNLPSTRPVIQFRTNISRLPMPFQGMFDNLSDNLLELWYLESQRREEEAERKEQALRDELEAKELQDKTETIEREDRIREEQEDKETQIREEQEDRETQIREEQEAGETRIREEQEARELQLRQEQEFASVEDRRRAEDLLITSIDNKLEPITASCNTMAHQLYPFVLQGADVTYDDFISVFGSDGYPSIDLLDSQDASIAGVNSLLTLSKMNPQFARYGRLNDMIDMNRMYFNPQTQNLDFDFIVSVVDLDARVDKLSMSYADKQLEYSHGPVSETDLSWPMSNSEKILINLYIDGEVVGNINKRGDWAIFKLIEEGNIVEATNSSYIVQFNIGGYEFSLKLSQNPMYDYLNVNNFRSLRCL